MTEPTFAIAGRPIGPEHPPYVIAELSANHLGRYARACAIIDAAVEAGADAVKLQTYRAETMTLDRDGPGFRIEGGLWHGQRLFDLYREAATPWEWHAPLFAHARGKGVDIFSSPFDDDAIDLLASLDAPAYKIASFELLDLELIARAARTGKPLILSTGMADDLEIAEAVRTALGAGAGGIALLHCVSGYPTPAAESRLGEIRRIADTFGVITGLSDHSAGHLVATAATALGAAIIEKHLTLARADGGPDGAFSMEPAEFAALVDACRTTWRAARPAGDNRPPSEAASRPFRRSVYAVVDIPAGTVLTRAHVRVIRPGYGLAPRYLPELLGRVAAVDIPGGTPMHWGLLRPRTADAA